MTHAAYTPHATHATVLYSRSPMSTESTRNWTRTYAAVIVIEVLVLMGLWWLQSHYGT